jgi:glucokinase
VLDFPLWLTTLLEYGRSINASWCDRRIRTMTSSSEIALCGDIGATNARVAILADGVLGSVHWIEVARVGAINDFLQARRREGRATKALFAVAGPVESERCSFTNCSWTIDRREMQDRFEFQAVRIINDFEATALSLPHLGEKDISSLGGGHAVAGARTGAIAALSPSVLGRIIVVGLEIGQGPEPPSLNEL